MFDFVEDVVNKLIEINGTVATAESCTGGMIASSIVDVSGASACFNEGFVTYSNEAKVKNLGVQESTLDLHGAVSEETAVEMARGVMERTNATFGISSTGIAGPTGGTDEKPVGLIYVAVSFLDEVVVKKLQLSGSRTENRKETTRQALTLLDYCIDSYKLKVKECE